MPPLKLDVGSIALSDRQGGFATGTSLLVGLNWATIYPKRVGIDVGVGYVGTFIADTAEPAGDAGPAVARGIAPTPIPASRLVSAHGGYLEVSMLAHEVPHLRTWVSGRAELLRSGGKGVLGMATRVSTELWSGISLGGRGGVGFGVFAIGAWAEVGVRELPGGGLARQVSGGISGRVPFFAVGR